MNLGHALMEIYAVVFLFGHTDVSTRGKRVVLFLYLLNGGYLTEAKHILILTIAKLRGEPLVLSGCLKRVFKFGYEGILFGLDALLLFALSVGYGFFGCCLLLIKGLLCRCNSRVAQSSLIIGKQLLILPFLATVGRESV